MLSSKKWYFYNQKDRRIKEIERRTKEIIRKINKEEKNPFDLPLASMNH